MLMQHPPSQFCLYVFLYLLMAKDFLGIFDTLKYICFMVIGHNTLLIIQDTNVLWIWAVLRLGEWKKFKLSVFWLRFES